MGLIQTLRSISNRRDVGGGVIFIIFFLSFKIFRGLPRTRPQVPAQLDKHSALLCRQKDHKQKGLKSKDRPKESVKTLLHYRFIKFLKISREDVLEVIVFSLCIDSRLGVVAMRPAIHHS